jgi:hypothetical protein
VLNALTCAGCGFEASNPGGPETPAALVVGGVGGARRGGLAPLRPWSLMLVIAGPDDYIDDLLAAQRA